MYLLYYRVISFDVAFSIVRHYVAYSIEGTNTDPKDICPKDVGVRHILTADHAYPPDIDHCVVAAALVFKNI